MTNPFVNPWTEPTAQTSSIFLDPLPNPYREQMTPRHVDGLGDSPMSQEAMQAAAIRIVESPWFWLWRAVSAVGAFSGAYHGYKRNNSVGWAIGWFIFGGMFPVLSIPISLAQGFGKAKSSKMKNRRRNGKAPARPAVGDRIKHRQSGDAGKIAEVEGDWAYVNWDAPAHGPFLTTREPLRSLCVPSTGKMKNRRRRNEYLIERHGGTIQAPTEDAARATAERRMAAGETWTRIWKVGPGGHTTLVGRYGRQKGGRGAVARRLNAARKTYRVGKASFRSLRAAERVARRLASSVALAGERILVDEVVLRRDRDGEYEERASVSGYAKDVQGRVYKLGGF